MLDPRGLSGGRKIAMAARFVRETLLGFIVAVAVAAPAMAEPIAGVDASAALPLAKYRSNVNTGGAIGLWGGYGVGINDWLWAGFVLEPRFTFFAAQPSVGKKTSTIFSLTGGPRLTARAGDVEGVLDFRGGLYTDVGGIMSDTNGGWNGGAGIAYYLAPTTSLGAFARYERTGQRAAPGSDDARQFITTGLSVQHRFLEAPAAPPPAPAPAVAAPAPPPPAKQKLVLRGVNFDFDSARLRSDAKPVLDEAVRTLKANDTVDVSVDGYTDGVGGDAYNLELSERRARAVADYLVEGGVSRQRLTVKGFGKADPVAANDTADGRAQNRRVELRQF